MLEALQGKVRTLKRLAWSRLPVALQEAYASHRFADRYRQPNTAYLETTSACNLNCVMCAAQRPATKRFKPSGFMDVALFRRLVDEIVDAHPGITSLYLHKDGEPLLHPRIVPMIEHAAARHRDVTLVTNATLLDDELSRAILATPLQRIRFSVDGLTRATFERVRVQLPGNEYAGSGPPVGFEAVMRNIDRFLELRQQSGNRTIEVGLRTTDFRPTSGELDAYRAYWLKRVEYVDVAHLISWTGEVGREKDDPDRHACMAPWAMVVVSWDGKLVPCCTYVDTSGAGQGNLFDLRTASLASALRAERRRALMKAHLDGDLDEVAPYCVGCRDWRSIPIPLRGRDRVLRRLGAVAGPAAP